MSVLTVSNSIRLTNREAFEIDLRAWGLNPDELIYNGPQPVPSGTMRLSFNDTIPLLDNDSTCDRLGVRPDELGNLFLPYRDEVEDLADLLIQHLLEGEVAVLTTSTITANVYAGGRAVAVNTKGERIELNMDDIYETARTLDPQGRPPRW